MVKSRKNLFKYNNLGPREYKYYNLFFFPQRVTIKYMYALSFLFPIGYHKCVLIILFSNFITIATPRKYLYIILIYIIHNKNMKLNY